MRRGSLALSLIGLVFVLAPTASAETPLFPDDLRCDAAAGPGVESSPDSGAAPDAEAAIASGLPEPVLLAGCVSYCMQARRDCSNSCWTGSGEAVFSCGPDGFGGCQSTCYCCEYPYCNGP